MTRDYCAAWEFVVLAPKQAEFERRYAPDGEWAQLLRQVRGFIRLELLRDLKDPLRCATPARECAGFTARETPLGEFGDGGP